jgi:triosephosphate isomerase
MGHMMAKARARQPVALANWKMEMTISQSLAYLDAFKEQAGDLPAQVQVILCPPFTALWAMTQVLGDSGIQLGVQTVSVAERGPRTGEISAGLARDAGASWALLGHWEARRNLGEDDSEVNQKLHQALEAGLRPVLLVGEGLDVSDAEVGAALDRQLQRILTGCSAEEVRQAVFIYEPEWAIGAAEPAPTEHVDRGCQLVRSWVADHYSQSVAQAIRLVYGGSVSPTHARELLALPDLDGLGAGRQGRDPFAFAAIVRAVAQVHSSGAA